MLPNRIGNCAQRHTYVYMMMMNRWWYLVRFKLTKCGPLLRHMKHLLFGLEPKVGIKVTVPGRRDPSPNPCNLITADFSSFVSQRRQVLPKLDTYCFLEYPIPLEKGRFPDHKQIDKACFGTIDTYYFTFLLNTFDHFLERQNDRKR